MKTFSRILGSITLVFVAFFLIGVFVQQISYEIELKLNKPVHQVFDAITDRELQRQWVNGLIYSEITYGQEKAAGSVYSVTILDGSRTVQFIHKIEQSEPDSLLEYTVESKGIEGRVVIQFSGMGESSILTIRTELSGNVWFTRSMLPLLKQTLYERNLKDYEKFKSLLRTV